MNAHAPFTYTPEGQDYRWIDGRFVPVEPAFTAPAEADDEDIDAPDGPIDFHGASRTIPSWTPFRRHVSRRPPPEGA